MSAIDNDIWNDDKVREPYLNPRLIEKPLIEENRYNDFDDLNSERIPSGFRLSLEGVLALIIIAVFLLIMILYWIKWR